MSEKRKNKMNVRVTDFTKEVLRKASKEMGISEVKVVEQLVINSFPEHALKTKVEMVGK